MIANNAQSTASMINKLCIANSTFDAWIELIKVVTLKNIIKEKKKIYLDPNKRSRPNLTFSQHSTAFLWITYLYHSEKYT